MLRWHEGQTNQIRSRTYDTSLRGRTARWSIVIAHAGQASRLFALNASARAFSCLGVNALGINGADMARVFAQGVG
ncbi:MAG: hypothetical protein VX801_02075 [Gemmatimonadota bacterium]|nr:hypothetical protein [Gemmatimonadota bacterium]